MDFGIIEFIVLTVYSKNQTLTRPHYIKNTNCQACFVVVVVVVTESSKYSKEKINSSQKYSHCRNFLKNPVHRSNDWTIWLTLKKVKIVYFG